VDPALLAEKAAAEADNTLANKFMARVQGAGVSVLLSVEDGNLCFLLRIMTPVLNESCLAVQAVAGSS
jgi:hypothetical protein